MIHRKKVNKTKTILTIPKKNAMNIRAAIVMITMGLSSLTISAQTASQNTEGVSISGGGVVPPDPSAMLDVQAQNKGILIPRVALLSTTDVVTISNPAKSLLVFNTTTGVSGLTEYFYYWDGTKWVQLGSTSKVPKVTYSEMQSMRANLTIDDIGMFVFVTDRGFIPNVFIDDTYLSTCTAEVYGMWYLSSVACSTSDVLIWRRVSTNLGTQDPNNVCGIDSSDPTYCDPAGAN